MSKRKNNTAIIIVILAIALLGLFMFSKDKNISEILTGKTLTISNTGGMVVKTSHEFRPQGEASKLKTLVITPQGSALNPGDTTRFTEALEIWEICSPLEVVWKLKKGSNTIASDTDNLGSRYPSSLFSNFDVTAGEDEGVYTLEANWRCNGVLLGTDGKFGGTSSPSTTTFEVIGEGDPIPDPTPEPGKKICWFWNHLIKTCESINVATQNSCSSVSSAYYDRQLQCLEANKDTDPEPNPDPIPFDMKYLLIIGGIALIVVYFVRQKK